MVCAGVQEGTGGAATAQSCQEPGTQKEQRPEHTGMDADSAGILGFQDSALHTGLLWAFPFRQRPEAGRRGGSDASDFKSQLQRGQAWRTSPGMHGAGRMVGEPLPRDAGLTPSWGWEAEAKGTLTGWGPAQHLLPCGSSHLSPVPQDTRATCPPRALAFFLVKLRGGVIETQLAREGGKLWEEPMQGFPSVEGCVHLAPGRHTAQSSEHEGAMPRGIESPSPGALCLHNTHELHRYLDTWHTRTLMHTQGHGHMCRCAHKSTRAHVYTHTLYTCKNGCSDTCTCVPQPMCTQMCMHICTYSLIHTCTHRPVAMCAQPPYAHVYTC